MPRIVGLTLLLIACQHDFPVQPQDAARDRAPDQLMSDRAPDQLLLDRARDVGRDTAMAVDLPSPSLWCTSATLIWTSLNQKMVICEAGNLSQCTAPLRCEKSWHMCTPTEYASYFSPSSTVPVEVSEAWLAGCIRSNGTASSVSNSACSLCGTNCSYLTSMLLYLPCSGGAGKGSTCPDIGVKTSVTCNKVGDSAAEGMWQGHPNHSALARVACCR
jgi:hypothetical protein